MNIVKKSLLCIYLRSLGHIDILLKICVGNGRQFKVLYGNIFVIFVQYVLLITDIFVNAAVLKICFKTQCI